MGLTSSHRIFTTVLKPVFGVSLATPVWAILMTLSILYFLFLCYTECEEATLRAIQLFVSLGFKIHPEKSVIIPTQI